MSVTPEGFDTLEVAKRLDVHAGKLEGRTVVLAGASGFLGRHLVRVLGHLNEYRFEEPCRVLALDLNPLPTAEADLRGVTFLRHDITQPLEVNGDVHYVIHASGIASPQLYRARPLETIDVATVGTRKLLELATAKRARFLFFSSSEIYGDPDPAYIPTPESYRGNVSPQGPRACYDESKRLGETLCYVFGERFSTHANVVRPFNVFGPGMPEADYRVLPNFASRLKRGLPLEIYGSGTQTRTYCYVTDAISGFFLVLLNAEAGRTYNIGNPRPEISVLGLVATIEGVVGHSIEVRRMEHPPEYPADEPSRRCPDVTAAQRDLGFEPRVRLEDGLRRFLSWSQLEYGSAAGVSP